MTMGFRPEPVRPQADGAVPSPAAVDRPADLEAAAAADRLHAGAPAGAAEPAAVAADTPRPQADFAAPINVEGDATDTAKMPGGPPLPVVAGGGTTPRKPAEPRVERPLTRHIRQGMPSYWEPEPQIAGVVGRAARGGGEGPEFDDPDAPAPRDGGVP